MGSPHAKEARVFDRINRMDRIKNQNPKRQALHPVRSDPDILSISNPARFLRGRVPSV